MSCIAHADCRVYTKGGIGPLWIVLRLALIIVPVLIAGCGSDSSESEAQELLRKQMLREQQSLNQPKSFEEKVAEVQDFLDDENLIMAERTLSPLLISQPDDPEALRCLAVLQKARGELREAVQTLDQIKVDSSSADRELQWMAIDWLIEAFVYDVAEAKLKRLLEQPEDRVRVHRQLAALLNNQGRRIEAARHLEQLARLGAIREKELLAMIALSSVFIDESLPKPNFSGSVHPALLSRSRVLHSLGDFENAIELIQRLRSVFPDSTPIAAFEFRLYGDVQRSDLLREWVTTAPKGIEKEPEYWATLGTWWQRQDRHPEAVRFLAEAVRRDPTDRFSYDRLQRSLILLGEESAANEAMRRRDLLNETARLAEKLGKERGTPSELGRMAEILMQLQRPWEALGWSLVALNTYGGTDEQKTALEQKIRSFAAIPGQEHDSYGLMQSDEDVVLCGIELSKWPLPTERIGIAKGGDSNVPSASPTTDRLVLKDRAQVTGLDFQYDNGDKDARDRSRFLHQLTGGGIGVIDYDLDGWPDLYLSQGGGDAFDAVGSKPNQLMRNLGGQRWRDVSSTTGTGDTGYGQGIEVADLNQDGFPDLVVANVGVNVVYINRGDGTFQSQQLAGDQPPGRWTTSIACGDVNGDHLPELVEVNYVDDPNALVQRCTPEASENCNPKLFDAGSDRLWTIGSDGKFRLSKLGDGDPAYGFAALITDFDGSAGNELFIANDAGANHLWRQSEPNGDSIRLIESARVLGCAVGHDGLAKACMGVAWGDFDRNGMLDLHITNFWNEPSNIYLQRASGLFMAGGASMGVFPASRQTVGWGTVAVDLDRNGWLDLAVLNGHVREDPRIAQPFDMKPQLFLGNGDGFRLVDQRIMEDPYWSDAKSGRTMSALDWNRDGNVDLVTNHLDEPLALLENQTVGGHSLRIRLVGTESERDAIGAVVTVVSGDQQWVAWRTGGDGFLCSQESVLDFGTGELTTIDRVEVRWPTGKVLTFDNLTIDSEFLIIENQPTVFALNRTGPAEVN